MMNRKHCIFGMSGSLLIAGAALCLMLSGCSSGTTSISTAVGGVETNSSDIGRYYH